MDRKIKVTHIINSLGTGGAENMLYKLIKNQEDKSILYEVITLIPGGKYQKLIEETGVRVISLDIKRKPFQTLIKILKLTRSSDIVSTWLYVSDTIGLITKVFNKNIKLVWNIRHANLDREYNSTTTNTLVKLNSRLSRFVDQINYNSTTAKNNHEKTGYSEKHSAVIYNGFDSKQFRFSESSRNKVRKELKISPKEILFIFVGRDDPQKDIETLLKIMKCLKNHYPVKLMMIGSGLTQENVKLQQGLEKYAVDKHTILLGEVNSISDYYSAADIYISTSVGESFSNALGEAMLMELPCVVTNVGDNKNIVRNLNMIFPSRNIEKGISIIDRLIREFKYEREGRNRDKIVNHFNIPKIITLYEEQFLLLAKE